MKARDDPLVPDYFRNATPVISGNYVKEQPMSEHEDIEKETVRLLVEELKKAHTELVVSMSFGSTKHRKDCPICKLIRKHDK